MTGEGVTGEGATGHLAEIYQRRYPRFLRVAEAIVGDQESAREVVQDAFVRLLRSHSEFRGEGSLDGWVWRAVVNTASNRRRDDATKLGIHHPSSSESFALERHSTNGDAANQRVRAVVALLPARQKLVLFLRYYADLDYRSIAEVLNVQTGTVGATLNQAHAAMRRLLEEVPQ